MTRFNRLAAQVGARVMSRAAKRALASTPSTQLPDGLHVFISGAGSPMPDPLRAGPGVGIIAGHRAFVIDTGAGSITNLQRMRFPIDRIEAALITHLHSDHIDGLGEFLLQSWIRGNRKTPTPVHGPAGIAQVVEGFNLAYQIDSVFRFEHHGPDIADPAGFGGLAHEIILGSSSDSEAGFAVLVDDEDLRIIAFAVHHHPVDPAFGFRIDYRRRSVTISGDTVYHPGLVSAATGTDLLLHDALNAEMAEILRQANEQAGLARFAKIAHDIQDYHATPVDAARAARDAQAKSLVLTHIAPPLPSRFLHPLFLKGTSDVYGGPITIAHDGMLFSLPAGNDVTSTHNAFRAGS